MLGMNAVINRAAEFKVQVNGALNSIPAANDAHRMALETFRERGIKV